MRSERYRWVLAGNLFAILTVASGLGFYNLSVYMNALAAQRGFSIAAASGAVGVFFLSSGATGLAIGRMLQRSDARLIMIVGAFVAAVALAAVGVARSPLELYGVYAVFGAGYACVSVLPATTLLTRWFPASERALAVSFAMTGLSLGGVVVTPLTAVLLADWPLQRATALLGAILVLAVVPMVWLGIRSFPADVSSAATAPAGSGAAYSTAVRSRFFVLLTAGYVLVLGAQVGGIAHLYNRGASIATALDASLAVSVLAMASVAGRLVGGALIGRIPIRRFTLFNVAGQLLGFIALAHAQSAWTLWIGAGVFGATVGNVLMLQSLILAQAYGVRDYPRIFSLSQALTTLGVACGPVALGAITAARDYPTAFSIFAGLSAAAFALIAGAGAVPAGESPDAADETAAATSHAR